MPRHTVAYGTIFTHVRFRPKIKLDVFFPARKAVDECWEVRCSHHPPPPSAHFQLFGGRQYIVKKTSRHQRLNRLTSINVDFVRPDDGDVDLIRRISAGTTAKISWGLVTPC